MTFARFSLFWALILLFAPVAQPAFSQASLQARDTAPAGGTLSIAWQGPGGRQDTIYVTAAGAPDDAWHLALTYASKGSPAVIALNDKITPGQYEIRYRSVEDDQILARRALTVVAPQASLSVPSRIIAGEQFEVGWTGPNEPKDYIALAKPGEGSIRLPIRIVRTANGAPVTHRAPSEVGPYVLRHQMGGSHLVVVEAPTEVVPAGTVITDLPPTVIETDGAIAGGQDAVDLRAARSTPGPFDQSPDLVESKSIGSSNPINVVTEGESPDGTAIPGDMFDPSQQAIPGDMFDPSKQAIPGDMFDPSQKSGESTN